MRLDRLITLGVVQPIGRAFGRFPAFDAPPSETERTLPVLMYHSISDDPEPAFSPYYKVCTSPARFAEHMQWLAEAGWQGVTLSEGLAALRKEGGSGEQGAVTSEQLAVGNKQSRQPGSNFPRSASSDQSGDIPTGCGVVSEACHLPPSTCHFGPKPIAITFDDGFRDFYTAAFPVLKRHGFTATMYLPTASIGDTRKQFKHRDCLTWGEVEELQQAGMEFGSHTVNHPKLVSLDWPEIEAELRESKATIEQRLGREAGAFAYPFAFPQENREFTHRLSAVLQALGYQSCVTTRIGRVRAGDSPFTLKRLPANSCDDRPLLAAKTSGAYDWLGTPQSLARRAKNRHLKPDPKDISTARAPRTNCTPS